MEQRHSMEPDIPVGSHKYGQFELLAILATGLLKFIIVDGLAMRAFYIVGICLFWLIYVLWRYSSDHAVLNKWGFRSGHFRKSLIILTPFFILCVLSTAVFDLLNDTIIYNWHILPVLALYPIWGILQQFIMLGLIAGNLQELGIIKFKRYQIILLTSLLFSLVHYPSVFLMIFTFVMEVVFVVVYFKWRNLWAPGIIHGWTAAIMLYYGFERDLWTELFAWF